MNLSRCVNILFIVALLTLLGSKTNSVCRAAVPSSPEILTWIGGTGDINANATNGTITDRPEARDAPATAFDSNRKIMWLFGGRPRRLTQSYLGDLWAYNLTSNSWKWVYGSLNVNQPPVNCTPSVPANCYPRSRAESAMIIDRRGKLWILGGTVEGFGHTSLKDFWSFDPETGAMTYKYNFSTPLTDSVPQDSTTMGPNAHPGARYGHCMIYDNATDSIYTFGGYGVENGANYMINQVWRYSIAWSNWTFVSGNRSHPSDRGSYGTRLVTLTSNRISSRYRHSCFLDQQSRELWVLGGSLDAGSSAVNDWWKYSLANGTWTWMGGPNNPVTNSTFSSYGQRGVENTLNIPPRRGSALVAFEPSRKQAFMYGGSANTLYPYSDFWRFDLKNNTWTWLDGSQGEGFVRPRWTTPGNSSVSNNPGSRHRGSAFFIAATLTVLGGSSAENNTFTGVYSDIWAYDLTCSSCGVNETCARGVCLLVNGASSDSADRCASGIISADLHCCAEFCGPCGDCISGICQPLMSVRQESACPQVNCSAVAAGWDTMLCAAFNTILPGSCGLDRSCNVSYARCKDEASPITALRPGCGSQSCRRGGSCLFGASIEDHSSLSQLCLTAGTSCETTGLCDGLGFCVGGTQAPVTTPPVQASPGAQPISAPMDVSGGTGASNGGQNTGLIVGVSIAAATVAIAVIVVVAIVLQRRKRKNAGSSAQTELSTYGGLPDDARSAFNINANELSLDKKLGEGSFGAVFLGFYRSERVAVKQLTNIAGGAEFFRESSLMIGLLRHPNVVSLIGLCQQQGAYSLVMEYMPNGSLSAWLTTQRLPLPEKLQLQFALGIAQGMASLASQKVVHRDLAARNVLLDAGMKPRISDFGFARVIGDAGVGKTTADVGPIKWMSPESIGQKEFSEKSDVWSYGCVLCELSSGREPFDGEDIFSVAIDVRDHGRTAEIPAWTPIWMVGLIKQCWAQEPSERPTFADIVTTLTKLEKTI